jgi:beta-galactosidase
MNAKLPLICAILCWVAGRAPAQVNLLRQGSFENPGADTGWAQGFNIPNNEEYRVVSENGKHWLRIENRDAGRQLDYVHAYVRVSSKIASLRVSVRMRATGLRIGKEGWHTARVALMFEGGSFGFPREVPELRADSDWVTKSVELKVPMGATRLNIQPAMFYCTGVFEIADLTVTPRMTAPTSLGDAILPAGITLNWEKARVHTISSKRAEVSLDGVWRFQPTADAGAAPRKLGWGYIAVPGDWQIHPGKRSDFVALGGGPQWDLYEGANVAGAWYERQASIPADWKGRATRLRLDRVCTDAEVYVNGMRCGRVNWPWGSVDITRAVTAGTTAEIRLLVAAVADAEKVGEFWQNALSDVTYRSATLTTRGLTGSVHLESHASAARVTDVFLRPSTRKKDISIDVELAGVTRAGQARFVAEMLDEHGAVEKTFAADAAVEAMEKQTLGLSWPWPNARLWDIGQPNLYTVRLRATGPNLDDEYNQEFGFREFWVEGRKFFLNGTEVRLRQGCFYNGRRPQVGENFWEMGSPTVDARGDASDAGRDLGDADRKGYLAAVYVLNIGKYMMNPGNRLTWEQNRGQALERAAVWIRHYRNHPSAVMWIAGMNFFNSGVDADPRHIGRRGWDETNDRWKRLMAAGKEIFDGLKKVDPTRAYYSHAGAYTGDVYTMNCYLDLIPLEEREDWLSDWAGSGEMPISMVEFGTPMDCTFRRGRHGFTSNITSEPLLTEYSAIYFGKDAYTTEEPEYRQYLHDLFRSGMLYNSSENRLDEYGNMHQIQRLFRTNTWRSWRTAGLPGGLRTWSWIQDGLKENNDATLAWIAGPAGAYTAKDHHFHPGQKIEKQMVLINDSRRPQDFRASWSATTSGKEVGRGVEQGCLAVSEIRFLPIRFTAPAEGTGGKAEGQILLTASIGQSTHHDVLAFRVFGEDRWGNAEIAVVDPNGITSKMLEDLGYATRAWNGGAAALVVVGRNALKQDPATAARLEAYVRGGGRAVVCGHDPDWMARALGWRVCPHVGRRVFPVNSSVTREIDADDLRDWTGSSTLIEAYPRYLAGTRADGNEGDKSGPQASQSSGGGAGTYVLGNEGDQPYAGWHWGNRGAVSSAAIEKPHRSGWRPLLECEFDLAYTPLMELDYGQGRLIACTLDLEDHVALDPAARRVAGRIMDYAMHSPLSPRVNRVVYLGSGEGATWLDRIGVCYERSNTVDATAGLLLIGPDAKLDGAALVGYLEAGGKAFFLPCSQASGPMGTTLKPAAKGFAGSLSAPDWPEARGLSASDLRWRSHLDAAPWVVSAGADIGADGLIGRKAMGKGTAIFCQIDPDRFQADQRTYFRYTRWRSTRAVAQLLANLGARFPVDSGVFHPMDTRANKPDGAIPMKVDEAHVPLMPKLDGAKAPGYYHPDYRTDFPMGDNPYRYYRW